MVVVAFALGAPCAWADEPTTREPSAEAPTLLVLSDIPEGAGLWRVSLASTSMPVTDEMGPIESCAQMPMDISAFTGGAPSDEDGCNKVIKNTKARVVLTTGCREDALTKITLTKAGPRLFRIQSTAPSLAWMVGEADKSINSQLATETDMCDPERLSATLGGSATTLANAGKETCKRLEGAMRTQCEKAMGLMQQADISKVGKNIDIQTLVANCRQVRDGHQAELREEVQQGLKAAAKALMAAPTFTSTFDLRYLGSCEKNTPSPFCTVKKQLTKRLQNCKDEGCKAAILPQLKAVSAKCPS